MSALEEAYSGLIDLLVELPAEAQWEPTGCAGWCVRDLVFHLLGDAQRALVALATPADGPATTTAVDYWRGWRPGTDAAAVELRMTRVAASAWSSLAPLRALYDETARAVLVAAARVSPDDLVRTQGHVLTVADLRQTLAVEAAVHHLDLVVGLDRPGPPPGPLALTRRTAEALLGEPLPAELDDDAAVRAATGRAPAPAGLAGRLPLFG